MLTIPERFDWPAPWASLEKESQHLALPGARAVIFGHLAIAESLADELKREICAAHPLAGHQCVPVAYNRADENEFVFVTSNPALPLAVVHLTWDIEPSPEFPRTRGFASLADFTSVAWK
jgi:hypothetical protein